MTSTTRTTESIRWRGGQVTRIEALTDAVFGFAITLLVVSLDVPKTFDGLMVLMKGFIPFAASFALLILVWTYHYRLFSRFDLEDGYTVFLNSVLLFVVLFYVYPLKFVFNAMIFGGDKTFSSQDQVGEVMLIYGAGYVAVFLVFTLLYLHAYRLRHRLKLTTSEIVVAQAHIAECVVMMMVGFISMAVARLSPPRWAPMFSGFTYFLIGPAQWMVGSRYGRLRELAEAREKSQEPLQPA